MNKKLKIYLILAAIVFGSCLQTLIFPVIIGAICVGIVSGIFSNILYEGLDLKMKNIYLSMIFMLAAEIGVIIATLLMIYFINLDFKLGVVVALIPPKAHTISYFLYSLAKAANKKRGNQ